MHVSVVQRIMTTNSPDQWLAWRSWMS